MKKPWAEMTDREKERYYNSCSKCGGEKDAEGWCANYCMNDAEELSQELDTILAHKFESPWGHCPCGWMVWVPGSAVTKTCSGCGRTLPIKRMETMEEYRELCKMQGR